MTSGTRQNAKAEKVKNEKLLLKNGPNEKCVLLLLPDFFKCCCISCDKICFVRDGPAAGKDTDRAQG